MDYIDALRIAIQEDRAGPGEGPAVDEDPYTALSRSSLPSCPREKLLQDLDRTTQWLCSHCDSQVSAELRAIHHLYAAGDDEEAANQTVACAAHTELIFWTEAGGTRGSAWQTPIMQALEDCQALLGQILLTDHRIDQFEKKQEETRRASGFAGETLPSLREFAQAVSRG